MITRGQQPLAPADETEALRDDTNVGDIIAIKHQRNGTMAIVHKKTMQECEVETTQIAMNVKTKKVQLEFARERAPLRGPTHAVACAAHARCRLS